MSLKFMRLACLIGYGHEIEKSPVNRSVLSSYATFCYSASIYKNTLLLDQTMFLGLQCCSEHVSVA
jgi:hypothetical protein